MTTRISILLEKEERRALDILARRELRDVRQQATLIIRRELERCGLLPIAGSADKPTREVPHAND